MLGQGIEPAQHHLIASMMTDEELTRFLHGIKQQIEQRVSQLPPHHEFLKQYCPA